MAVAPSAYHSSLEILSDGSVLVGVLESVEGADVYTLHRIGPDGREIPGWPVRPSGDAGCAVNAEGRDGTLYVACWMMDGVASLIVALDAGGRAVPGWPVRLDGANLGSGWHWGSAIQLGPDGTVYALTAAASGEGLARLWAFAPDGRQRTGWPVTLEALSAGYLVAPGGRVLVGSYLPPEKPVEGLCGAARATVFAELDRHGGTVAGWPQKAAGLASVPAVAPDGTVYYLTRDRVVARAPDGSVRAGWPVAIADVYPECGGYGPYLGPDGTVYVFADGLRAFSPDGRPKPGWPFRPAGGFSVWPCVTDVSSGPPPAFGADGTVYLATTAAGTADGPPGPGEVTAVDADGRIVPGWPYPLPPDAQAGVGAMTVVGGRLYAEALGCATGARLLALEPDGSLAR